MPIKGLTDIVRLPRLGKIKLGIRVEGESGPYPAPTSYFVCPPEVRKVFGERPTALRVLFPTEHESQWAQQWLKCYSATRGLVCRGDGETAIARVDPATGEIASRDAGQTELREIGCDPEQCPRHLKKQCRRVMTLQFFMAECPGIGVYEVTTSSFYSIVNINSAIDGVKRSLGRVHMIPLLLRLVGQTAQPEGSKKTVRVLRLDMPYPLSEMQRYGQAPPSQVLLLPPPDTEAPEDLFPQEVLGEPGSPSETTEPDIPVLDGDLLQSWRLVKERLKDLRLRDSQVARWFRETYALDVAMKDFESVRPPYKYTARMLSRFAEALLLYQFREWGAEDAP